MERAGATPLTSVVEMQKGVAGFVPGRVARTLKPSESF
jgi:hypothetical protein